jgi:hypothetical protein
VVMFKILGGKAAVVPPGIPKGTNQPS